MVNIEEIIKLDNMDGVPVVSSREVSVRFGKRHSDVLEKVDKLISEIQPTENSARYFILSEYLDDKGEIRKEYLLTRDGFSLIVMGFTGIKALNWKLKYIDAFNKMEQTLKEQNNKMLPTTYKESLIQLLEQVEKNEQLEAERVVLLPKATYHDDVLNKSDLITTTIIAKDLGFKSATKLNTIMFLNKIIYKNASGTWIPYASCEWLITEGYSDYRSYTQDNAKPSLQWTEKGRKWILENYKEWEENTHQM